MSPHYTPSLHDHLLATLRSRFAILRDHQPKSEYIMGLRRDLSKGYVRTYSAQ